MIQRDTFPRKAFGNSREVPICTITWLPFSRNDRSNSFNNFQFTRRITAIFMQNSIGVDNLKIIMSLFWRNISFETKPAITDRIKTISKIISQITSEKKKSVSFTTEFDQNCEGNSNFYQKSQNITLKIWQKILLRNNFLRSS